jgi:endonuclease/exonuclease/phosphatase (EEP) superfamily protein YafD
MLLEIITKSDGLISILTATAIIVISIATMAGILGRLRWQFDLFSHFRVQYLFLLIGFTGISLFFNNKLVAILGFGFIFFNLLSILPFYSSHQHNEPAKKTSRILLSNVLKSNEEYGKLCDLILATNPDIIFLIETSAMWLQELSPVLASYPYSHNAMKR